MDLRQKIDNKLGVQFNNEILHGVLKIADLFIVFSLVNAVSVLYSYHHISYITGDGGYISVEECDR